MAEKVYEIAILGRASWNFHSLNNEGTVGNVTEPRTITLADGSQVDGISGEMLKHIHTRCFWTLVNKNKLCDACKKLSPMKASNNPEVNKRLKETKGKADRSQELLDVAIRCPLCDIHGFLIEEAALSRKSTVEFGWALALPMHQSREIHTHIRVAVGEKAAEGEETPEQMVYNRPTRSGIYAIVTVFQPWRIGLNEINYRYVVDDSEIKERYDTVIEAYKAMFVRLEGAMTTTRLPHFSGCEGVIVISKKPMPACLVSPLEDNYKSNICEVSQKVGNEVAEFSSVSELLTQLDNLKNFKPFKL